MQYKSALVFGGQGSQYNGMGKKLLKSSSRAKKIFDLASSVVGYDVAKKCIEAEQEELNRTKFCQVCTLTLELAIYELFKEYKIPIDAVAGFSLGEYAALVAAEVISVENAFKLVKERALAMEEEVADDTGSMYAIINMTYQEVEDICHKLGTQNVAISNYNSYNQFVVSVNKSFSNIFLGEVKKLNGKAMSLKVNRPFHHPLMKPAADRYLSELQKHKFSEPIYPCYFNVNGDTDNSTLIRQKLYDQIYKPVLWSEIIERMLMKGISVFYEISPKPVLYAFIKNISDDKVEVIDVHSEIISELWNFDYRETEE